MKFRFLPPTLLLLASSFPLSAATVFTWTGTSVLTYDYASFSNPANWSGGSVPPSNASDTALVFGSSPGFNILVPLNFAAVSIAFTGNYPAYNFVQGARSELGVNFGIGADGINVGAGSNPVAFSVPLTLLASQTWTVTGNLIIEGFSYPSFSSIIASSGVQLTKSGTGSLTVYGSNSFSGGVTVTGGTLLLGESSYNDGGIFGPVGSGILTLRAGTRLAGLSDSLSLDNPITVESGVTFGDPTTPNGLVLRGALTLQSPATTLILDSYTQFQGNIGQTSQTSLTLTGGLAALSGNNTYTGGTTANGGGVIFGNTASVPATGSIQALNNGYVGSVSQAVFDTVLGKITNPTGFTGSLGLDTSDSPFTFTNINLSGFSPTNFKGLGTFSSAYVSGSLTPPSNGDYKFGGGNGTLWVTSNLTASGSAGVALTAPFAVNTAQRLTVVLQGADTFTGSITVSGANLVFDSAAALPGSLPNGPFITLGANGYAGYTEAATNITNVGAYVSRIAAGPAATGIIGIDSHDGIFAPRTLTDTINLSGFTNVFLGTQSKVTLSDNPSGPQLTPPSSGQLSLAGVNGGYLNLQAALLAAKGVASVNLGYASTNPYVSYGGAVELGGVNDYTGATTLASGYLVVGTSSNPGAGNSIVSGPLGRGSLIVPTTSDQPGVAASVSGVTLHNPIQILGARLLVGADVGNSLVGGFASHNITLNGVISGAGALEFQGSDATLTLAGNNSFSGGFESSGSSQVIVKSNSALGTGPVTLSNTFLNFDSAATAPAIGSLDGTGSLVIATGSTLQINQQRSGTYSGTIDGSGVTIKKIGTETLTLAGNNTYSGTTQINQGTIIAAGSSPFGSSTISFGGGNLTLDSGATVSNSMTFSAPTRLSGSGSFTAPLTVGTNATLAPGSSPGTMYFTSGLTFASGGAYEIDVQSATDVPGFSYDTLSITGTLAFTSTSGSKFQLDLVSLSTSGVAGAVSDFSALNPYSWKIASASGGITGFSSSVVAVDTSRFTNALSGGFFSVSVASGTDLMLNFTPVPEPSTWALLLTGFAGVVVSVVRRRSSRS